MIIATRKTAEAIIYHQNKVLIIQNILGGFDFPGGGINRNESPEDAVIRELGEELGIKPEDIEDSKFIGQETNVIGSLFKLRNSCSFYRATLKGDPRIKPNFEIRSYVWMEPKEALEKLSYDGSKKMLRNLIS